MANEAQLRTSLYVRKQADDGTILLEYQSRPSAFAADVSGTKGPVPGAIQVTTSGTDVDFSQLTTPGLCRVMNFDSTNYVEYGIRDPDSRIFYPLGELLPGESFVLRLSRNIQEEYFPSTGTGTTTPANKFHFKANTAACSVLVEAFEK